MNYSNYLRSDHWRGLRDAKLLDANDRCERCKRKSNLQVHHKTYERFGCEKLSDLLVLCESCHEKEHNLFPIIKDDWEPPKQKKTNRRPEREKPDDPLFKYVPRIKRD
jgi:5-methylcytosine-specific restriction endonuclease McrA